MTRRHIGFAGRQIRLPQSRALRIALGVVLILAGFVGFLPILGFWMIPLGLMVLSVDLPLARRLRRRATVWWGHQYNRLRSSSRSAKGKGRARR
jgi:purine-cytosine permease-like protein